MEQKEIDFEDPDNFLKIVNPDSVKDKNFVNKVLQYIDEERKAINNDIFSFEQFRKIRDLDRLSDMSSHKHILMIYTNYRNDYISWLTHHLFNQLTGETENPIKFTLEIKTDEDCECPFCESFPEYDECKRTVTLYRIRNMTVHDFITSVDIKDLDEYLGKTDCGCDGEDNECYFCKHRSY